MPGQVTWAKVFPPVSFSFLLYEIITLLPQLISKATSRAHNDPVLSSEAKSCQLSVQPQLGGSLVLQPDWQFYKLPTFLQKINSCSFKLELVSAAFSQRIKELQITAGWGKRGRKVNYILKLKVKQSHTVFFTGVLLRPFNMVVPLWPSKREYTKYLQLQKPSLS